MAMPLPYVGEIRMFAGSYAPQDWAFCQGQTLNISDYEVLFQILGTTYGGDGQTTFMLPNLQGRVPVGVGGTTALGQVAGTETVTLTSPQMPTHSHPLNATTSGQVLSPSNALLASVQSDAQTPQLYGPSPATVSLALSISTVGGNQSHTNIQPYLCISFIIALFGEYPSPS